MIINDAWSHKAKQLYTTSNKIKELKHKKENILNELIQLSNNKNTAVGSFEFKKITSLGDIKYKDIPELKNIDLEKYRLNSVEYWKLFKLY